MADTEFRAVLIADCGIDRTRVTLVDIVGGSEYRLIAQRELATTVEPPLSDVTVSIRQAVAELERNTGRQLLEDGRLRVPQGRDGQGVDAFVATCSAGGAIPLLVLAVTADITAQSALRAAEGTYAVPFRVVTMEEILRVDPLTGETAEASKDPWWKAIDSLAPGGLLLVGGIEGGNVNPLRTLARSLAEALAPRPTRLEEEVTRPLLPVIYAGNSRAREVVQHHLADRADLRVVENIRPRMREEQLLPVRQEIARLYEEQVLQRVAGYEGLASWSQSPVQLPYMGLQLMARFLATHYEQEVLALDLGSGATAMVWARGEACERVVLGHYGLGYGIARVLAQRGAGRIRQWLPFPVSEEEVRHWVLNQALRPRTVPTTVRDFLMQQAVAREILVEATAKLRPRALGDLEMVLVTGGALTHAPRLPQSLLAVLDAIQPCGENPAGLVNLYLDRSCLLPSIGALATLNPDAAACVLLKDGLFHLGPCLVPLGKGKMGGTALGLELEFANGMRQQVEVPWGKIVTIPFNWGEQAHLTLHPARGVRVGLGRPGDQVTTKGGEMIHGGNLGLVVDARGRPLELPPDDAQRQALLREWLEQAGAYTAAELEGLIPVQPAAQAEEEAEEVAAPTEEPVPES